MPKKLDDVKIREKLLDLVARGHGRKGSCEQLGFNYITLYRYLQDHPEFRQEVEEAEYIVREKAVTSLMDILEGSEDEKARIAAAKAILQHTGQRPQAVEHRHTHELTAGPQVLEIVELQRRLQDRALPPGTLEVPYEEVS